MKIARDSVFDGGFKNHAVFLYLSSFFYLVLQHIWMEQYNTIKLDIDRVTRSRSTIKFQLKSFSLDPVGVEQMRDSLFWYVHIAWFNKKWKKKKSLTVIFVLVSPQTHEFLCIQSEPNLCDPGPVGGTTFPQRQHQPAGHRHGWHWQTGSHDIPGLWWRVLTQKSGRETGAEDKVQNTTTTHTHTQKTTTTTAAGIEEKSCPNVPLLHLRR